MLENTGETLAEASSRPLYRDATRAALLGLVINLLLGVVKLVGGIVGRSFALISDAVNSLGDVFASVVVIYGLNVAQRPPDDEHPYGHTKAEAIAGSNVALLIILSAAFVGYEALLQMSRPHSIPPIWTLFIAGANVIIKEALYRYKLQVGHRLGSSSVIANAWDHRSDAMCSLAVLVGLALVRWGGPLGESADEWAALVVAGAIICSGILLFRHSASELMDLQADPDFVGQIRAQAQAVPGVEAVEKLWVRKSGLEYFVDIHIEVDRTLTVDKGHRISHDVKDSLLEQFASVRDVLVHLEPFPHEHDYQSP